MVSTAALFLVSLASACEQVFAERQLIYATVVSVNNVVSCTDLPAPIWLNSTELPSKCVKYCFHLRLCQHAWLIMQLFECCEIF